MKNITGKVIITLAKEFISFVLVLAILVIVVYLLIATFGFILSFIGYGTASILGLEAPTFSVLQNFKYTYLMFMNTTGENNYIAFGFATFVSILLLCGVVYIIIKASKALKAHIKDVKKDIVWEEKRKAEYKKECELATKE